MKGRSDDLQQSSKDLYIQNQLPLLISFRTIQKCLIIKGVKEVLSGSFAGIVGTIFGHPLDLIKVRLQTQNEYKGTFDCLYKVWKNEGIIRGFYRGLLPPIVNLTFLNSLSFGSYSQIKIWLSYYTGLRIDTSSESTSFSPAYFIAGGMTGSLAGLFSTPFEMVKIRMQLDNISTRRFTGSFHCVRTLYREQGLLYLYTGFRVNTLREVLFGSVYFGSYEHLKHLFYRAFSLLSLEITHMDKEIVSWQSSLAVLCAGGISGMSAWLISFPLDCIKSNIQGSSLGVSKTISNKTPSINAIHVMNHIWRTRGIVGFYNGIGPSVVRAFIVSSVRFSAYELAYSTLGKLGSQK